MQKKLINIASVILTGLAGALIYPTVLWGAHFPDLGILAWIYLVPLLVILPGLSVRQRFLAGFSAGLITYGLSLYWMVTAMVNFGGLSMAQGEGVLLVVVVVLSLYFTGALLLAVWIGERTRWPKSFLYPLFLTLAEYARTHFPVGGFAWSMPAYSQGSFLSYFQWIDLTGVDGLNFYIFLVNGLVSSLISPLVRRDAISHWLNSAVALAIVILGSFYGSILRQNSVEEASFSAGEPVALIQGNIPQEMKWDPRSAAQNFKKYGDLTRQAEKLGARWAIWPETAYPYTLDLGDLSYIPLLGEESFALPILFGTVSQMKSRFSDEVHFYNSAFVIENGYIIGTYHKRHLVPYGEYVPFRNWLTFAKKLTHAVGDFTPGSEPTLITSSRMKIGSLICYEDIFPGLAREAAAGGANLLVNITNDAWYGNTSAQHQHLVFSQFRALENRRYLLRATNTGITAVIDPRGEILARLNPFEEEILIQNFRLGDSLTFFTRMGDYVVWICALAAVGSLFYGFKRVA